MAGFPNSAEPQASRRAVAQIELTALLRPELEELRAYVPHDPPGIRVKLDANEAPPCSSPAVRDAVARAVANVALERYPDPRALRLKEAIARRTGARPEDLLVGSGSDEVIALVLTAMARPREKNPQPVILSPVPTFVMYRVSARGHGHKPVEVPLDASWDLDVTMMKRAIEMMRPNIVFIASPNNPTSNRVSDARLREVIEAAAGVFVIVDEAYVDYAAEGSVRSWREEYPHLGILRTVSKIGLAALRVGWLEADSVLMAELDKVRQPFNLSATSLSAAAAVIEEACDDVQRDVARVVRARDELTKAITALDGFTATPSSANFVWVKTPGPAEPVFEALVKDGVLVRSFHASGGRLGTQLRITIGTDAENEALVRALERARARGVA
ncbi:MAG: Histidinol-phosphate aminotransferase [Labilithrix sp.]|nr:Histidinol-phosphate aminotransferase [Labilithrix sp.]